MERIEFPREGQKGKASEKKKRKRASHERKPSSTSSLFHSFSHKGYMNPKFKLTPELRDEFVKLTRKGRPPLTACERLGVNEATFYKWIRLAKEWIKAYEEDEEAPIEHRVFVDFYIRYREARAKYLGRQIDDLNISVEPNEIRRTLAILERRDPKNWSARARLELVDVGEDSYDPDERFL